MKKTIPIARLVEAPELSADERAEITRLVFYAPSARPADALLVFGAPEGDWSPAAKAYKDGLIKLIVASGGVHERTKGFTEAFLIKQELVRLGVPEADVIEDGRATNSLENVLYFKEILESRGIVPKSILF